MNIGYIILGHGSRASEANESLKLIANLVTEKLDSQNVKVAYMGLCEPTLEAATEELVNSGCGKIIIMPFFLYRGIHLQEDIPAKITSLTEKHDGKVVINFAKHIGVDDRLADIVVDRIKGVS
ncbi:MAG: CbiX/SirB N-terminal domain-containing protein [Bacillota bacterium]|nr:CbiX/SirB N-terminal domain-containing protein [Bacillota bacterium]